MIIFSIFYYFLLLVCFLIDMGFYNLFNYHGLYLVQLLFYIEIFKVYHRGRLISAGLLLLLESFLYSGTFAIDLAIMLPLAAIAYWIRVSMHLHLLVYSLCVLLSLLAHYLIIDYGVFLMPLSLLFNLKNCLFHGIIIILLISYIYRGSRGNRSIVN